MSIDPQHFRQALSRFASGVTVVSARRADGAPIGVTVSAFCSVSLTPPLILVCLDKATLDLAVYAEGPRFAVNVLAETQQAVSNAFAYPGPVPPFEATAYRTGAGDVPLIEGTVAALECSRFAAHDAGDHVIVVGLVDNAVCREGAPLLYANGGYRGLAPAPEAAE